MKSPRRTTLPASQAKDDAGAPDTRLSDLHATEVSSALRSGLGLVVVVLALIASAMTLQLIPSLCAQGTARYGSACPPADAASHLRSDNSLCPTC